MRKAAEGKGAGKGLKIEVTTTFDDPIVSVMQIHQQPGCMKDPRILSTFSMPPIPGAARLALRTVLLAGAFA